MTRYKNTMAEALRQVYMTEDNMDLREDVSEGKEKSARQLVNPSKEQMVVKNRKVIVIDKKDVDSYLKKGWSLAEGLEEGTWAIPDSAAKRAELKKMMKKPIPAGKATDMLYNVIGDDELFDDIGEIEDKDGKNADVRPVVKAAIKRLGIKESLDEGMRKVDKKHEYVEIQIKNDSDVEKVKSFIAKNSGSSMEFDDIDSDGVDGGGMGPSAGTMSIEGRSAGEMGVMIQKQFRNKVSVVGESFQIDEVAPLVGLAVRAAASGAGAAVANKAMNAHKNHKKKKKEEVEIDESVIDKVKEIDKKKSAKKIDGVMVDSFTASAISQIYDKVNDKNKKRMEKLPIKKLADLAMKFIKHGEDFVPEEVGLNEDDPCWDNYKQVGMKKKDGKKVPNCVPEGLDEAMLKDRDYEYDEKEGVVKISKKNFAKVHKDYKGTDKSKPTMMVLTKKGTSLVPVQFKEYYEVGTDEYREYLEKLTPGESQEVSEGKMKELHSLIASGKTAEQIAKIMKLDVKTIKSLMAGYNEKKESFESNNFDSAMQSSFLFDYIVEMNDEEFDDLLEGASEANDLELIEGLGSLIGKGAIKLAKKAGTAVANRVTVKGKLARAKAKGDKLKMKADLVKQKQDNKDAKAALKAPKPGDKIKGKDGKAYVVGTDGKATTTPYSADASAAAKDRAAGKKPAEKPDAPKKPDAKPDAKKVKKPVVAKGKSGQAAGQGSNLSSSYDPEGEEESFTPEGAAADARRSIARDKDLGRRKDSADDDNDASVADVKAANKNIIQQLKKILDTNRAQDVEFLDKKKSKVDPRMAKAAVAKYMSFRRSTEKGDFQAQLAKSYKDFLKVLKNDYTPTVENTILDRIDTKLQERKNG